MSNNSNLGKQVADHYQGTAYDVLRGADRLFERQKQLIEEYKVVGRRNEIQAAIKELKANFQKKETDISKELCYLTGEYREMYLHGMKICQEFATLNRIEIANIILGRVFGETLSNFMSSETIHNYIDHDSNIVRKNAVSAKLEEKLLIPINMRDGSLICIGKGNADWNCSAPHGAGRLYSRKSAKENFTVEEFKNSMKGIFSTSINESTLDESPMAYKNMADIIKNISSTVDILKFIKPIYNFKSGE